MSEDVAKINQKLVDVLSQEKGYFGRIAVSWGQSPTKYEYIGYKLTEDFVPILEKMTNDQRGRFVAILNYFELHAQPLQKILKAEEGAHSLEKLYAEISWSQFMTLVMFGMLEISIKEDRKDRLRDKRQKILNFLESNLAPETKEDITMRYKVEGICTYPKEIKTFSDVINHLWLEVRSGFIHDGSIESKGLEWSYLKGIGSKNDPIILFQDVPMQEFLQITWQAIMASFGYRGQLKLPNQQ